MDWLIYLLLLYLGYNVTALYECKSCKCCKTDRCQYYNGYQNSCIDGCIDGYYGTRCTNACMTNCLECENVSSCTKCKNGFYLHRRSCSQCPQNCLTCSSKSNCSTCRDGFYNGFQYNLYSYFDCRHSCKDTCKSCTSYSMCNDCKDGKYNGDHNDCRVSCNLACKSCTSYNNCTKCETGKYGELCEHDCGLGCENHECDIITGYCKCISSLQGDKCYRYCDSNCLKCNKLNGECSACRDGKYLKDCSKDCTINCNATNGLIKCDIDDGACLTGCNTPTKYGSHCDKKCSRGCINNTCNWITGYCINGCVDNFFGEPCNKECSVNCNRNIVDGRSCHDVNGDCTHGCKNGFHGNKCERKCSENCEYNTCDKATGKCFHGCKKGFSGSHCTVALSQSGTDEDTTIAAVGAAVGALPFILIIIAVTIVLIVLKRRRNRKKEDRVDTNGRNATAVVTYSEMLTGTRVVEQNDTGAMYAMPNKRKSSVSESKSHRETTESTTVNNPDQDKVKDDSAAVYENAVVRYSQQTAAKENVRQLVESALEIEEDLAVRESKPMAQTGGSYTYESEAADTQYTATAVKKRRILLDKLADFVSTKTKEGFVEEFLQLPLGLIKPFIESQKRKNVAKNRYKGIYPYDDTRVVLKDGDSDYINASYIDGYVKRRAYIASIGPTNKYMGDMSAFWKMVWQEQVGKIVMLTKLSEAGVPKCDQYWPDKDFSELYGNVQVTCKSEAVYADYTVRSFVAQKGSEKRSIVQVHFTAWPDKGIPDDVTSLIEFRQRVNSIKTKLDGPIIVHCSAGIGRTGTYIALDSLTIEGEVEGGVDIYACVRNLREQRVNLVQTAEQYRYLHNAVVHTLTFNSKAVEATKFSEYMNIHTHAYLAENFQKLQASVESCPDDEIEAVNKNETLINKNRKGADIPGDRNRPRLYLDRNLGSTDYINALYINSFKSVNRYIVAQTPMPDTLDDFLVLIVQENVTCIIDMESHVTKQDNVEAYYPADNQTLKKGMFTVKSEPVEKTDQYIFRQLKISHRKSEEITVKHIQFTKWDDKTNLPEDPGEFVQFIRDIELKYCDGEKEGPILVHCLHDWNNLSNDITKITGAEKSGLFCAVSVLLEKTQTDQEISVVNTVRQIKYRRHMSVPNKEQYIFCHQCLNEYLRSFDTYSNFGLKV